MGFRFVLLLNITIFCIFNVTVLGENPQIHFFLFEKKFELSDFISLYELFGMFNSDIKSLTIKFNKDEPFNGIFKYLTNQIKMNLHMTGIIRVTSSGTSHFSLKQPHDIICPIGTGDWISNNAPNSFIQIDFRKYLYTPSFYSVKFFSLTDQYMIKSWVIEGSVDGEKWFCLDEERLDQKFNDHEISCRFFSECPIRFIRFCQTTLNKAKNNILSIHSIELFGDLAYIEKSELYLKSSGFM